MKVQYGPLCGDKGREWAGGDQFTVQHALETALHAQALEDGVEIWSVWRYLSD